MSIKQADRDRKKRSRSVMQVALPSLIWKLLLLWLLPIGTGGETGVFVVRSNWASGTYFKTCLVL